MSACSVVRVGVGDAARRSAAGGDGDGGRRRARLLTLEDAKAALADVVAIKNMLGCWRAAWRPHRRRLGLGTGRVRLPRGVAGPPERHLAGQSQGGLGGRRRPDRPVARGGRRRRGGRPVGRAGRRHRRCRHRQPGCCCWSGGRGQGRCRWANSRTPAPRPSGPLTLIPRPPTTGCGPPAACASPGPWTGRPSCSGPPPPTRWPPSRPPSSSGATTCSTRPDGPGRREPREAYLMDALEQICREWLDGQQPATGARTRHVAG